MGLLRKEDMHESFWKEGVSNPNLLINGNFKNPVNQRGLQSYTVTREYTIDRWKANGIIKLDLVKNGIKITPSSNGADFDGIRQYIEDFKELANKKITLSIKVNSINEGWKIYMQKNGIINYGYSILNKTGIHSLTINIDELEDQDNLSVVIENGKTASTPIEIEWIKLELGSVATPFVPRPYIEELDLCQRYYCRVRVCQNLITTDDNQILVNLKIPKNMRINPTATFDTDVYFHNSSDGNAILIKHKGDSPESMEEYSNDCNISCWILNASLEISISPGLCGTINSSNKNGNRLSDSVWIKLNAEIY